MNSSKEILLILRSFAVLFRNRASIEGNLNTLAANGVRNLYVIVKLEGKNATILIKQIAFHSTKNEHLLKLLFYLLGFFSSYYFKNHYFSQRSSYLKLNQYKVNCQRVEICYLLLSNWGMT